MLYRNKQTGMIISAETFVCGDWEPVNKQAPVSSAEVQEKKVPVKPRTKRKKG